MEKMKKLCELIESELHKIAEKGLTTSNLETAYKLVDMYKDLKNTEYWETKGEYYDTVLMEMQGGYSEGNYSMMEDDYAMRGRKRDRMGRYSRNDGMDYEDGLSMARGGRGGRGSNRGRNQYSREGYSRDGGYSDAGYERYMDSKQSYRSEKSGDSKQRLMESLEDYMEEFTDKIKEMHRDADTPEERELIGKFMTKLQNIR